MFNFLRKFNNLGLAPVVIWLFVQLAMTGMFLPANASTRDAQAQAGFSNTIVICTGIGLKSITLTADGSLPQDAPDKENYCPWCMQFGNLSPLNVPVTWQALEQELAGGVAWDLGNDKCTGQNANIHFQSRAPPL